VVGHKAIGRQTHRDFFEALGEDFLEDLELGEAPENVLFAVGAIQDVVNDAARRLSSCSWHSGILCSRLIYVNVKRTKAEKRLLTPLLPVVVI